MTATATPIAECLVPAQVQTIDGVSWMLFYNDGTYKGYKSMPNGLNYKGKSYGKVGWNSDTHSVSYREMSVAYSAS